MEASDKELLCLLLRNIINLTSRMTSGNVSHHGASIQWWATQALEIIEEMSDSE